MLFVSTTEPKQAALSPPTRLGKAFRLVSQRNAARS